MIRILLPLAVVAAILLGPLIAGPTQVVGGIEKPTTVVGYDYLKDTIDCWRAGNYSIKDACEPEGGLRGLSLFAAVATSAAAAVVGILGLLPFIGRLTSALTTLAGVVALAAIGYFALTVMNAEGGTENLQWGTYLAGGAGLLTLISGLAGLRGR
jgi:hypothetical protein